MLFMGSEQFPVENESEKYLSENGGSSNAYTEACSTTYTYGSPLLIPDAAPDVSPAADPLSKSGIILT